MKLFFSHPLLNEYKEDLRNGDTMGFCSLYRLIVYRIKIFR